MNSSFFNRLMGGLVLIAAGVVFLLSQLGIIDRIDWKHLFATYWPLILIYFSLKGLVYQKKLCYGWIGSSIWNVLILVLGLYFLAKNLGYVRMSIGDVLKFAGPFLLIAIGLAILFRPAPKPGSRIEEWLEGDEPITEKYGAFPGGTPQDPFTRELPCREQKKLQRKQWKEQKHQWKKHCKRQYKDPYKQHLRKERENRQWHPDTINKSSFIGDVHLGSDYWELKPLNVSHFIGDTIIDLTKAAIPSGETRINISAFIGDVKLFIPDDADVEVCVMASSFIGDMNVLDRYEGGMMKSIKSESPLYADADKKLRVNVSMFIGDVLVKKVG
jgi:lia operon protein LiaF